jgi:hypothetical protein
MQIPCAKRMLIQALLIIRRISAQEHLGHPHWLYIRSFLDFADFGMLLLLFLTSKTIFA